MPVIARYNDDGSVDSHFNSQVHTLTGSGYSAVLQPDGKILVGGGSGSFDLGRYLADGSLDTSFGTGGLVVSDGLESGEAIALQADGKILLAGSKNVSGNYDLVVARYLANGSLDTSFSSDGVVSTHVQLHDRSHAILLQPDGKIVVAGETDTGNLDWNFILVRYNTNGSLDTTFSGDGIVVTDFGAGEAIHALALQPDGKILAAGIIGTAVGLARYNSDGSLDASFGSGGKVTTAVGSNACGCALALQPDGKVIVGGYAEPSGDTDFVLVRYSSSGSLDTGFGSSGKVVTDFGGDEEAHAVLVQPDGKIALAGGGDHFLLAQYDVDGTLDVAFSEDGKAAVYFGDPARANALLRQADGKLVAAGAGSSGAFLLARFVGSTQVGRVFLPAIFH